MFAPLAVGQVLGGGAAVAGEGSHPSGGGTREHAREPLVPVRCDMEAGDRSRGLVGLGGQTDIGEEVLLVGLDVELAALTSRTTQPPATSLGAERVDGDRTVWWQFGAENQNWRLIPRSDVHVFNVS